MISSSRRKISFKLGQITQVVGEQGELASATLKGDDGISTLFPVSG